MKISVVIPNFNDIRIKRSLDSLYVQTYQNFEIIVIDGGSTNSNLLDIYKHNKIDQLCIEKDEGIFVFTFKHADTFILQRIDRFENENTTYRISILFTGTKINQEIPDKLFTLKDKRLFN